MQFGPERLGILKDRESECALRTDLGAKTASCTAPGDRRHVETLAPFGTGGTEQSALRTETGAETAGTAGFGKGRDPEMKGIASRKMPDPAKEKVCPEHTAVTFPMGSTVICGRTFLGRRRCGFPKERLRGRQKHRGGAARPLHQEGECFAPCILMRQRDSFVICDSEVILKGSARKESADAIAISNHKRMASGIRTGIAIAREDRHISLQHEKGEQLPGEGSGHFYDSVRADIASTCDGDIT